MSVAYVNFREAAKMVVRGGGLMSKDTHGPPDFSLQFCTREHTTCLFKKKAPDNSRIFLVENVSKQFFLEDSERMKTRLAVSLLF